MRTVQSWGRLQAMPHEVVEMHNRTELPAAMRLEGEAKGLAAGNLRSYGDVGLNPGGVLWSMRGLDRFIAFDDATGRLDCEPGVLLQDIQRTFLPRGWTLAVTPGTLLVTVGGAIANDVHGKNHHMQGCFGGHVLGLQLRRTDGSVLACGPSEHKDWFAATVGGMGLTGVIEQARLQLRRVPGPWLDTETLPFAGLSEFFALADGSEPHWEHTVAWIDCLSGARGRGLFMRAQGIAQEGEAPAARRLRMPLVPPLSLVNRVTLRPFNEIYFRLGRRKAGRRITHHEAFLYPLDHVLDWNRMYGPRGFYQYQSVVPHTCREDATQAMLGEIARAGEGSFLAVLKTFGPRPGCGMLSFAMQGATLALDFANRGDATLRLFDRLDAIVREAGGRIYVAKDARMPREVFEAGYPRLAEFTRFRDPGIRSGLSRRLMGD